MRARHLGQTRSGCNNAKILRAVLTDLWSFTDPVLVVIGFLSRARLADHDRHRLLPITALNSAPPS